MKSYVIILRSNQSAAEKEEAREKDRTQKARVRHAQAQQGGDAANSHNGGSSDEELPDLDYTPITDRGRDPGASTSTEGTGIMRPSPQTVAERVQRFR